MRRRGKRSSIYAEITEGIRKAVSAIFAWRYAGRIIPEGTALTVYNDGTVKNNRNQNICLAFTVDDIDREYEKVQALGAEIIEPPTKRPWGAVNMSFYDPDNNMAFLRHFPENEQ